MNKASIHLLAFAILMALFATAAPAETRLVAGRAEPQFNPIGRLTSRDLEGGGGCTGALIAPDLVLTAAHCVPRRGNVSARRLARLTFAAGWGDAEALAIRQAVAVYVHPDHDPNNAGQSFIASDIALVRLARPITDIAPLKLGAKPAAMDDLTIAGYTHQTRQALTITDACAHFTPRENVLFLTCPVIGGNSGSPVLNNGTIAAVISSRGSGGAYAVHLDEWVRDFLED